MEDRISIIQNVFNATSTSSLQRTNEGMCLSAHFVKHHSLQQHWDIAVSAAPQDETDQWDLPSWETPQGALTVFGELFL